jgi:3-oxoacyl-[acyl-carrier-protein] synthase II
MNKRVVITGIGTVNPLGNTVAESWEKAKHGKSGIATITNFDPTGLNSTVAGEVKNFDPLEVYSEESRKAAKKLDNFVHFATKATKEALDHSGLDIAKAPFRTGICLGTGIGGMLVHQQNGMNLGAKGFRGVSPMYIPASIGNIAAGFVSMEYGIMGPNMATQTACATANHALAVGLMLIQAGMADAIVAGGTEASVTAMGVAGFANMRALSSKYNDTPERASRPYDKNRDGFVISEGAGVLILEEYEHAKARGAQILAELCAVGMSGDAYDLVAPHPEGIGALYSMQMALEYAKITPQDIDYINTHGTSTPLGDVAESKAVYKLLKGDESKVHVGSTKGMHGHLLGATAALEAILCIKAMEEGIVPPNINIEEFDTNVALKPETINRTPIEKPLNIVLSNSFGFGGHNSTVVLKKVT